MATKDQLSYAADSFIRKAVGFSSSDVMKAAGSDQVLIDRLFADLERGPALRGKARSGNTWLGPEGVTGTLALAADVLVLSPLVIECFQVYDQLGTEVTTAGVGGAPALRSVIFGDRGDGYPGKLIYSTAQVVASTTGFKGETALNIPLVPGLYWIGCVAQGSTTSQPTVRAVTDTYSPYVVQESNVGTNGGGYSMTAVTGTVPTDFSATVTVLGASPRTLLRAK